MNIAPNTPNQDKEVDNMNFILSSEKSSSPPIKSVEVVNNHSSLPVTKKASNESVEVVNNASSPSDKFWSVRDSLELAKSTKEGGRESFDAQSPESANSVNKTLPSIEDNNLPQETTVTIGNFTITVSPKKPTSTKKESSDASVTRTLSCSPTVSVLSLNLEDKDTKPYDESAKDDTASLILNTSKEVETQTEGVSTEDIIKAKELLKENTAFILDKSEELSMIQNEIVKKVRKCSMCLFILCTSHYLTYHMHT